MPDDGPPLPVDLDDPANWKIEELREFNGGRAAFLASIAEQCGVPRMNAFVHALEMVDGLDAHLAIHAVTASRLSREMTAWAAERNERAFRRAQSQRPIPVVVRHRGIAGDRGAAREARTWLRAIVSDHPQGSEPWLADFEADAVLCLNELVIAALTAGSTALTLSVAISADVLRMSVLGAARGLNDPLDLSMPTLWAQVVSFRIVNALADGWGTESVISGRELWAEFALAAPDKFVGAENQLAHRRALNVCT